MRPRTIEELLRDSHAGSILIAQFLATGLGGVLRSLSWPLSRAIGRAINFVELRGFRDTMPFNAPSFDWKWEVLAASSGLLNSLAMLLAGYLIAVWIYTPRKRKPIRLVARQHQIPDA